MSFHCPDKFRVRRGEWATATGDKFGAFWVPIKLGAPPMMVLASDGIEADYASDGWEHAPTAWEHVSVSLPDRCPTWEEMAYVKSLFWDEEDCVVQYHPPRSEYVNQHPYCLHLWRPVGQVIPLPPSILVGFKDAA